MVMGMVRRMKYREAIPGPCKFSDEFECEGSVGTARDTDQSLTSEHGSLVDGVLDL
jgi:hypothetical protein